MSYIRTPETLAKLRASARRSHPRGGADLDCVVCGAKFYVNPHRVAKARACSRACNLIHRRSEPFREAMRQRRLGEKSFFWRGGRTSKNKLDRESSVGKWWSRAVKERDDYTCQQCGKRGGELHADHIVPMAIAPADVKWDLSNGRTLCVACHRQTPTFGGRTKAA